MSHGSDRARRAVLVVVACTLAATACGGGSTSEPRTTSTTITPTTAAVAASAACAAPQQAAPERIDVTVDGTQRTALVHVPPAADGDGGPLPVVLSFHGVNGNAAVQQATDGLLELSDREGVVVVHPEGLEVGLNDQVTGITGWDPDGSQVDEPAFVAAVLDELGSTVCIDPGRVFATGFSAGGNIALVVACALPDRIAAVAPVGAAYQPGECEAAPPLPILAFHGRDDLVVPFEGRDTPEAGELVPVRAALDAQAMRNGCDDDVSTTELSPRVRSLDWSGCDAATTLVELDDHGHAWPGHPMPFGRDVLVALFAGGGGQPPNPLMVAIGEQPDTMADNVLLTNSDVDATELIWEFFSGMG
jgi:polyhydroxybutyrate depolymerase